jgi:hypothetical protein
MIKKKKEKNQQWKYKSRNNEINKSKMLYLRYVLKRQSDQLM